jgi:hypothetical protein
MIPNLRRNSQNEKLSFWEDILIMRGSLLSQIMDNQQNTYSGCQWHRIGNGVIVSFYLILCQAFLYLFSLQQSCLCFIISCARNLRVLAGDRDCIEINRILHPARTFQLTSGPAAAHLNTISICSGVCLYQFCCDHFPVTSHED